MVCSCSWYRSWIFSHGGNWIKLQNYGGLISGSSQVTDGSGILSGSIVFNYQVE